jgi:hypothetical protein
MFMGWNIKFNADNRIIELSYYGVVSPVELNDALTAAVSISQREGTVRFLADCSEMLGGHSITDLYFLISLYESVGARSMKEALILPFVDIAQDDVKFYETACLNRGFDVKVFNSVSEAMNWLVTP